MVKSILFVCTGNTCRSFMAEMLLRHHATQAGLELKIGSAGLAAFTGDTGSTHAITALKEWDIDGSNHRSTKVHPRLLAEFDLILPMTLAHKERLLELAPEAADKIFLLKEFAERVRLGEEVDHQVEKVYEISDPFGQSLAIYRQARDEIDLSLQPIIRFLKGGGKMKIVIGADHGGFSAKQVIIKHLQDLDFELADFGTDSEESCDYPEIAHKVSKAVAAGEYDLGILICGTGIGMSMAANKVPGIRGAMCTDPYSARMARNHNDSNVLCLGARVTGLGLMLDIVDTYLQESFAGGRHSRRVDKIEQI